MRTIVTMRFGSHLYGTATETSDIDIKEVHVPDGRSILLGKTKPVISRSHKESKDGFTAKNKAGDVDFESYSLDKFIKLFCEGQTVAIDMMFATPLLVRKGYQRDGYHNEWWELWNNRERLMSRESKAFIGYAMKQSSKHGIKGSRVAAVRAASTLLARLTEEHGSRSRLGEHAEKIEKFVEATEFAEIIDVPLAAQDKNIRHLSVCGRKVPYTLRLLDAYEIYRRLVDVYGQRALQAEKSEGVDWKALSHAVRVGTQSIEYLTRHFVTFPRPDAAHLLQIKRGKLPYKQVAEEIERLLEEVQEAASKSTLPDKPDYEWCDDFLVDVYGQAVREI